MQNQDSSNNIPRESAANSSSNPDMAQSYQYQSASEPVPTPYYPPYMVTTNSTSKGIIKYGLIGGAIACWIDIIYTLLTTFVPAVGNIVSPLYQLFPTSGIINAGDFIVSLLIALLCSPGFFVAGLLTARSTGIMSSAMTAWALALACFALIDLCLFTMSVFYATTTTPYAFAPNTLYFWGTILVGWFIDLVIVSIVGFGAATLGGNFGKRKQLR
jgi:hypothetical protein